MEAALPIIPLTRLAFAFIPIAVVLAIFMRWSLGTWNGLYATARMLIQLLVIGYALVFIFNANQPYLVLAVLMVMMGAGGVDRAAPAGPADTATLPRRTGSDRPRRHCHPCTRHPVGARSRAVVSTADRYSFSGHDLLRRHERREPRR